MNLRWLEKKDGKKVLQSRREVVGLVNGTRVKRHTKWKDEKDIPTVKEEK